MVEMKAISYTTFILLLISACYSKNRTNLPFGIHHKKIEVDTLIVRNSLYSRKIYSFNKKDSLDGFWRVSSDTLFFIPFSRVKEKKALEPFIFAILGKQEVYTPECKLSSNQKLFGIVYPVYIYTASSPRNPQTFLVSHNLHDGGDYESEKLTENWLKTRCFEISSNGIILNMTGDFRREGSLFCYD